MSRPILSAICAAGLGLLSVLGASAWAVELHPDVLEAELAFVDNDLDKSDAALNRRIAQNPDDVEALWRQARNLYQRGELLAQGGATPEQRMKMYREAQAKCKRIQTLDPAHPQGWFWEGTALGRIATAQGIMSSLFMADDIEDLWLKSSEMKGYEYRSSNDSASFPGDVYFALGQFYRLCPDWTLVKMLIGTKGDIDESIRWHRKGVAFSPSRPEMAKELGVSLLCKASRDDDAGAMAEGKKWLAKAKAMPSQKTTDDIDKKQIPVILSKADDACTYSRDGWQEVSMEAYERAKQKQ
jgi:tetratricopeptide (TPR) repeat protein